MARRSPVEPTSWRALSFHDPGFWYGRRLRVRLAKKGRRRPTLRKLIGIRRARASVESILRLVIEATARPV